MEENLRRDMESAFGADFSEVRIHEGFLAPAIGALALTSGNEIHVAFGLYEPGAPRGRHLIAHELVHVAVSKKLMRFLLMIIERSEVPLLTF